MRLTYFAAVLIATAPLVAFGCGGASDPLGGPYGGTESTIPTNTGNMSAVSVDGGVDDAGTSSSSGGSASGGGGSKGGSASSSGSGSSGGAKSSGSSGAATSSGSSSGNTTTAPTWSTIFSDYLANGTVGNCTRCHGQMSSASGSYAWLSSFGYIKATGSILVSSGSCLSWYGGNMPPGGTGSDAQAVSDINAWAAAGAQNN